MRIHLSLLVGLALATAACKKSDSASPADSGQYGTVTYQGKSYPITNMGQYDTTLGGKAVYNYTIYFQTADSSGFITTNFTKKPTVGATAVDTVKRIEHRTPSGQLYYVSYEPRPVMALQSLTDPGSFTSSSFGRKGDLLTYSQPTAGKYKVTYTNLLRGDTLGGDKLSVNANN